MANELGVQFRATSAPALEKPGDLAAILTSIGERNIFFIDEIHRLKPVVEEMLYSAMEDFEIDVVIGQGPARGPSRSRFRLSRSSAPPRRPASCPARCTPGSASPCAWISTSPRTSRKIVFRSAGILSVTVEERRRGDGVPVLARDPADCQPDPAADEGLRPGLGNGRHRPAHRHARAWSPWRSMRAAWTRWTGRSCAPSWKSTPAGPSGSETIAISIGEAVDTLEDVYEPYLIQIGFLKRTPRGRVATDGAWEHLGVKRTARGDQSILF